MGAAAYEGEDVGLEEHLDAADAGGGEVAAEEFPEGVGVVDAEAGVGGGGEAGMVLVEGELEEGGRSGRFRRGLRLGEHYGVEIEGLGLIGEEGRVRVWV